MKFDYKLRLMKKICSDNIRKSFCSLLNIQNGPIRVLLDEYLI